MFLRFEYRMRILLDLLCCGPYHDCLEEKLGPVLLIAVLNCFVYKSVSIFLKMYFFYRLMVYRN